jgi:hypothetical protein
MMVAVSFWILRVVRATVQERTSRAVSLYTSGFQISSKTASDDTPASAVHFNSFWSAVAHVDFDPTLFESAFESEDPATPAAPATATG